MKTFLVPCDGSAAANAALDLAISMLKARGGELIVAHAINTAAVASECVTPYGGDPSAALNVLAATEREILAAAVAVADRAGVAATPIALDGFAGERIVRIAQERNADAIVMGTSGRRGVERLVAGSVAADVLRTAPIPVFVVHDAMAAPHAPFRRIFVALDDSVPAGAAARFAAELAAFDRSEIVFCRVVTEGEVPSSVFVRAQKLASERGVKSTALIVHGHDVAEIIIASAEASGADLIALGTHARGGFDHFMLGSVAEGVVRDSRLPVVVLRGLQLSDVSAANFAVSAAAGKN
jgi:nucleotide-binding universal stress UspA family protein